MKKIFLSLLLAAASLSASAQLLWKVSGNGAAGNSYLFGTHHVAPYTIMDSVPGFNDALRSVDVVMGEIDMINLDQAAMQQATMAHALAPADSVLTAVFSPAQLDSINVVLGKYSAGQLSVAQLAPMKPAMVNTVLAMLQTTANFPDFDQTRQLDQMVQQRARQAGKAIGAFETIEEQLAFLLDAPIAAQVEDLMSTVRKDSEASEMARKLADAYLSQNLDAVSDILFAETGDSEMMEQLINARNRRWAEKLATILPGENVLVAVGCGHLPGENGLIELLRQAGYDVTPVK